MDVVWVRARPFVVACKENENEKIKNPTKERNRE